MQKVTLTFDNGPTPGYTEVVLELLRSRGISATFFVIGRNLDTVESRALVQAAHTAGHRIGNHSMHHTSALGDRTDAAFAHTEIDDVQRLIAPWGEAAPLFRPYGRDGLIGPHLFSSLALEKLLQDGYTTVLWNNVPGDWIDQHGWVDTCCTTLATQEHSVMVLHDIPGACVQRLPELLDRLQQAGVVFTHDYPDEIVVTRGHRIVTLNADWVTESGALQLG